MTALLLDSGVFAMALIDDPRLPATARARIEAADRVAISVVSVYEIGARVRLGKWPEMAPVMDGLLDQALADGFDPIPLSPAAALTAALTASDHRDPLDRIIAAVALAEDMRLVSPDVVFGATGVVGIWG